MTKKEFLERTRRHSLEDNAVGCVVLVVFFAGLFGLIAASVLMRDLVPDKNSVVWIGFIVVMFAFMIGLFVLHIVLTSERIRRHGLLCPYCRTALLGMTGQITLTTGKCGQCGERVIERKTGRDNDDDDDDDEPDDRDERPRDWGNPPDDRIRRI